MDLKLKLNRVKLVLISTKSILIRTKETCLLLNLLVQINEKEKMVKTIAF
jgi:hypothetical protein